MSRFRILAAATLALSVAALAATTPAQARGFDLRTARFTAQFEGTRTVKWNEPSHQFGSNDCYHRSYSYGNGDETWKVKSKPAKLLFVQAPGSKHVLLQNGTWNPQEFGADHAFENAAGIITRSAFRVSGWQPGSCGGEPGLDPARNQKCGSRLPTQAIDLDIDKGKLIPSLSMDTSPARGIQPFADCEILLPRMKPPDTTLLPEFVWPREEIAGRAAIATLFGKRKTVTITGGRKWDDVRTANGAGTDGGTFSTTATFAWKLTLTRAKRSSGR